MTRPDSKRSQTLTRALRLVRHLEGLKDAVRLSALAHAMGVTTRTVRRDLAAIEAAGATVLRRSEDLPPYRTLYFGLEWPR